MEVNGHGWGKGVVWRVGSNGVVVMAMEAGMRTHLDGLLLTSLVALGLGSGEVILGGTHRGLEKLVLYYTCAWCGRPKRESRLLRHRTQAVDRFQRGPEQLWGRDQPSGLVRGRDNRGAASEGTCDSGAGGWAWCGNELFTSNSPSCRDCGRGAATATSEHRSRPVGRCSLRLGLKCMLLASTCVRRTKQQWPQSALES